MQEAQMRLCLQERLLAEKQLHLLACEEVVALRERQQHNEDYQKQEAAQSISALRRDLCEAGLQNEQLKLEVLRWRKQSSLMRLKLASARENVQLHERNIELLNVCEHNLVQEAEALRAQLASTVQQLTEVVAAKAQSQAECSQYQGLALQAEMQNTKLHEDVKLANGRYAAAAAQLQELQQQLSAARAENVRLQAELGQNSNRRTDAAAAHEQLQRTQQSLQHDLRRLEQQIAEEQKARAAAEALAAAAAQAAGDALAVKEQQLAEWKLLNRARKETATQQLQLSQAQLDSMRETATVKEAKLLDELAAVKQLLEQEKLERCTAEAGSADISKAAAAGRAKSAAAQELLDAQLTQLKEKVAKLEKRAMTAEDAVDAAKEQAAAAACKYEHEAERAAAFEQELERLQEQQTTKAVQAVDNILQGLTAAAVMQPPAADGRSRAQSTAAAAEQATTGSAILKIGKNIAHAVAAATESEANQIKTGDDVLKQTRDLVSNEVEEEYRPGKAAAHMKAHDEAAACNKTRQTRSIQGQVNDQNCLEDQKQQPTLQSRGRMTSMVEDDQRPTERLAPAAVSGTGQGGRRSGVGGKEATDPAASAAAATSAHEPTETGHNTHKPPALRFHPQSMVTPALVLQQPGVMAAAHARVSAADMIKKLSTGGLQGPPGKPGARKRKLAPLPSASGSASSDVIPPGLLVNSNFQAPRVRKLGN